MRLFNYQASLRIYFKEMSEKRVFLICLALLIFGSAPVLALAADSAFGLVGCDTCTFENFLELIYTLLRFLIFTIAIPAAVLAVMVAGLQMVWAQDNAGAWTKAKENLTHIVWGFALIIIAGLLVLTILKLLKVNKNFYFDGIDKTNVR